MWKLSIEDDQGHKTVVSLVRDNYTVGRAQDNTIRLTERNISRHHAVIRRHEDAWELEDRASYNGCYVNGARVADPRPLVHGDLIQLGDYRLEVIDEAAAQLDAIGSHANTVPQLNRPSGSGLADRLVMLVGPTPGTEYPIIGKNILIGRGEECNLSINHGSVSRVHAELIAIGDGRYELLDRDSANGIRINGVEVRRVLLDARDTIEFGDIVLKFIPAGMYYRPGADESQQIAASSIPVEAAGTSEGLVADPQRRPLLSPVRIAAMAGLLVFGLLLAIVIVATNRRRPVPQAATSVESDSAVAILSEATSLAEEGKVEVAHERITTQIPTTSNARKSESFRAIEATWADALFQQAHDEEDRERKRAILLRIKDTETVDAGRRNRALAELSALDSGSVDVNELPPATSSVAAEPSASGVPTPTPLAAPFPMPRRTASLPGTSPSPVGPPQRTVFDAVPTTTSRSGESSGATAGDRASQLRTIAALKAKKLAKTATEKDLRVLRALCRQHNDTSCM
ncbi:MAG: FHA domain-containing protein [Polyangiaceae bacterium]|nr:FHA domain-containing protein [Polyangiaceae bacterium]